MEITTYIAMNRFKIVRGKEDIFEKIWKERDSKLIAYTYILIGSMEQWKH